MAIDVSGGKVAVAAVTVHISITKDHPLITLANALPWERMMALVVPDLKSTTAKGFWWLGPKLYVRVHLAAYIIQKLYNLTDRQTEYGVKDNAAYQLFSGKGIVSGWRAPDHTKIEEFRNRLSAETQRLLSNELAKFSVALGFADPSKTDFDSTVQEANIAYPSDASLMSKLCGLGKKVVDYLRKKTRGLVPEKAIVDMKVIKEKARSYFFISKNQSIEVKRKAFKELHRHVKQQMRPVIDLLANIDTRRVSNMPWNIKRAFHQIKEEAWPYLLDVAHFTRTNSIKFGKILSFHTHDLTCIKKGKAGRDKEFGRVFQLGRINGNFLFVLGCNSVRMEDKSSFEPLLVEHEVIFGKETLKSVTADKGYWSAKNHSALACRKINENGLQRPGKIKKDTRQNEDLQLMLRNRRAGIEPLIGHVKHGGQLGKSRMKSDAATLAAGYASVLGFNLRQLIRHQAGKMKKIA